jgi:lysophospholipase L1-like esterase
MQSLAFVLVLVLVSLAVPAGAMGQSDVAPAAPELRYFGRWDQSGKDVYVSQWSGAYVKVGFTGDRVTVRLDNAKPSSFYVLVDGREPQHVTDKTGEVELAVGAGGGDGTHQLKLVAEVGKELRFGGVRPGEGQSLKPARLHAGHVLFIGDSITRGASATNLTLDAWAPASADSAGLEHDRIAQGGIGLVSGFDAPAGKVGMEEAFFKLGQFGSPGGNNSYPAEADRQPTLIVINLGTNDGNRNEKNPVPMDVFQQRHVGFVTKLRERYPDATILALQLFNTLAREKNEAIEAAVQQVNAGGDKNVHYVSTHGWVDPNPKGGDIAPDWSHPTDQGHHKLTAKMAEVLKQYVNK